LFQIPKKRVYLVEFPGLLILWLYQRIIVAAGFGGFLEEVPLATVSHAPLGHSSGNYAGVPIHI
jgi:hypothetical protein